MVAPTFDGEPVRPGDSMKIPMMKRYRLFGLAVLLTLVLAIAPPVLARLRPNHVVFQTSTIGALLEGVYDGVTSFEDLKRNGNFGLGTVNDLDGEMIALDGTYYQVKSNGVASVINNAMKTPFAVVTFFQPEQSARLTNIASFAALQRSLDQVVTTKNIPVAIRLTGTFASIKVRSVPRQTPPYPRLADAVKHQAVFELHNVQGTLVGFRMPLYMQGVNVPGYHFHLLTADRRTGGHLLDCRIQLASVALDYTPELRMLLPDTASFRQTNLGEGTPTEINRVEK